MKDNNRKYSKEEIAVIVQSALGKTFGELNNFELKSFDKGSFGHIFEEDVFDYAANSYSEPDFIEAGVELKVTPYRINKDKTLSAKERLVFNIIDYENEYKNEFYTSHFWFKNNKLQIIWYLWEQNKNKNEFKVTHEKFLDLSESEDLNQIKDDWNYIINKIKNGKAHEISEADTMYLGACTKGKDSSSLRKQPNSDIMAKQRAFCFKTSYMTQLVRKYIGDYSNVEQLLQNTKESFIDYIKNITNKYIGKTQLELIKEFNIDISSKDSKGIYPMIINRMFNLKGNIDNTNEFVKANIKLKTVRVENDGKVKESMSFPNFKFKELVKESWEDSTLRDEFESTKYLLCVFQNNGNDYVFKGIKLWNMPEQVIENIVKSFWLKTVSIISNGIKFNVTPSGVENNLPGSDDNGVVHVRPHASESAYQLNNGYTKGDISKNGDQLPNGEWMTKQCFWINREYIKSIIEDIIG